MEDHQHNPADCISTVQPIPVALKGDSSKSSLESSPQTQHTFEGSLKLNDKYDTSRRIDLEGENAEPKERPEDLYFFHDKPYRLKKKWILFAMTCSSFAIIGLNDSAIGALIPQMEVFYNKSESTISLSFLANSGGYFISTLASSYMIHHMPLYIVMMISSFSYAAGSLIGTFKPPFAALMVSLILTGFGGGLLDTAATSVIVHFEDGPLITLAYSFFSIGAMSSPFLVGGLRENDSPWEHYFWFPVALAGSLFILQWFVYRSYKTPTEEEGRQISASGRLCIIFTNPMCVLAMMLNLLTMGIQDSWSQWASKYLQDTKKLESGVPQLAQGTFWAGVTVSRIVLSYAIPVIGENLSSISLIACFVATLAGMWKLPEGNTAGAICLNVLFGFADGPLMPIVLSSCTMSLPRYLKQPATSLLVCSGLIGSSTFPLVLGQSVDRFDTDILPGVLIVILGIMFCINIILHLFEYCHFGLLNGNKRSLYQFMRFTYTLPPRTKDTEKP
ncbi:MFS general substrate transporter [Wallemia mellicola]|nr:MFS general substrate transporter [Wallemia mellicola]TIC35081.1 MFS general substrate transporter [Wallemia mellicola]